ncbi:hypothetical protein FDP41_008900 [Naegleria fowleri]|uniref:Uncharacterized protein n=1 Tax=Naegleria fowleri TaxID=5763 RepID=A0A6A5BDH2_NAEFO|nr:uncharacterized protein FDP41_008900 [Naegleria fowleri]KAF0972651.1 hypothetical protein FDP41_008900 [Naegleria fowleri]
MSYTKGRTTGGVFVACLLVLSTVLVATIAGATENRRPSVELEGLRALNFFLPDAKGVVDADIVSSLKEAVSGEEEVELAQQYLNFAKDVKDLYDQITNDNNSQEISDFKKVLLKIVKYLTKKSSHPRMDLLKTQLSQFVNEQQAPSTAQQGPSQTKQVAADSDSADTAALLKELQDDEEEADSEWITVALRVAGAAMNVANNIGTYHEKISKVGNFISGKAANALDRVGLKGAAFFARKTGTSISNFSRDKIAPIENRVAQKIAPVVKSKPFQAVRKTLNVVNNVIGGVTSIKSGLNAVGLAPNVRLPRNYAALKSSLKSATRYVTSGNWRQKARQIGRLAKIGARNFKRGDWKTKYNAVSGFYNGASSLKAAITGKSFGFSLPGLPGRWGRSNNAARNGNNRRGASSRRGRGGWGASRSSRYGRNSNRRGGNSRRNRSSSRGGGFRGGRRGNSSRRRSNNNRSFSSRRGSRRGGMSRSSRGRSSRGYSRRSASSPRRGGGFRGGRSYQRGGGGFRGGRSRGGGFRSGGSSRGGRR